MEDKIIVFDEELYKKNIKENSFPEAKEFGELSDEDIEQLKKDGLM